MYVIYMWLLRNSHRRYDTFFFDDETAIGWDSICCSEGWWMVPGTVNPED